MLKRTVWALIGLFTTQEIIIAGGETIDLEEGYQLIGNGYPPCREGLETLSVAGDNMIKSKADWDLWVKENPLFVLGGADS